MSLTTVEKTEKKEGVRMCKVLDAREARGEARGIKQGIKQGALNTLVQLVRDGLLSLQVAAERAQMSTEEFQKQL